MYTKVYVYDEIYVEFNGKRIGEVSLIQDGDYAVLHYDSDLSWDLVDTETDAVNLLIETDEEYRCSLES